jgi:hypothetical protein
MEIKENHVNEEVERNLVMDFLRQHPGVTFEESEIKIQTGVAKNRVRNLVRGIEGIDEAKLDSGEVCWNPLIQSSLASEVPLTTDH